jgi:hypothetical protein
MDTPRMHLAQEEDAQGRIDQEKVFQHVPLVLAALTRFLCGRVVVARDGSLGAVMTNRGVTGGGTPCTASAGNGSKGKDGTSISRRARKASTSRQGASLLGRRVLRTTGNKTCIHWVAFDWRIPHKRPCSSFMGFCLR